MQKHRQIGGVSVWARHFSADEKKTRRSGFFPRPLSTPCRQRSLL